MGRNFFANYNWWVLDVSKVTFGDNCFIAAGNPAGVIRTITGEAKKYCFRDRVFDEEAWAAINKG